MVVTPSRIAEFRLCRRIYFNRNILSLRGEELPSEAAQSGLTVHAMLAEAHASGACISTDSIEQNLARDRPDLAAMLHTHQSLCPATGGDEAALLGVETELAWWDRTTRIHFRGRADAVWSIAGTLVVRDYKTGKHPAEDHRERLDTSAYAVLAAANFPSVRPIRVQFEYLADGVVESVAYDEFAFDEGLERLRAAGCELSDARDFRSSPGTYCATCRFGSSCPDSSA